MLGRELHMELRVLPRLSNDNAEGRYINTSSHLLPKPAYSAVILCSSL